MYIRTMSRLREGSKATAARGRWFLTRVVSSNPVELAGIQASERQVSIVELDTGEGHTGAASQLQNEESNRFATVRESNPG